MKNGIVALISFIFSNILFAQQITIKNIESRLITDQGVEFVGTLKDKTDDEYLNNDFDNEGIIYVNNNTYFLNNIDFNITTNTFESRLKLDKFFSYDGDNLDSVSINGFVFKKIGGYFYEILFELGDTFFLKKYDLRFKAGSVNRLDGSQAKTTALVTNLYLLKYGDKFKSVELSKKGMLELLNENEQEQFLEFVKDNNLSYRNEEDTVEMIKYILKNSAKII